MTKQNFVASCSADHLAGVHLLCVLVVASMTFSVATAAGSTDLLALHVSKVQIAKPFVAVGLASSLPFIRFNVTDVVLCRMSSFHGVPSEYRTTPPLTAGSRLSCTSDSRFFEHLILFDRDLHHTGRTPPGRALLDVGPRVTNRIRVAFPGLSQSSPLADLIQSSPASGVEFAFDTRSLQTWLLPGQSYLLEIRTTLTNSLQSLPRKYRRLIRQNLRFPAFFIDLQQLLLTNGAVCSPPAVTDVYTCPSSTNDTSVCNINLGTDADNCGRCARACTLADGCQHGQCLPCIKLIGNELVASSRCPGSGSTCLNLNTDNQNCGACQNACAGAATSNAICVNGTCRTYSCNNGLPNVASATIHPDGCRNLVCVFGYADCDGNYTNGCELYLGNMQSCGACPRSTTRIECIAGQERCAPSSLPAPAQPFQCSCLATHASCVSDEGTCSTNLVTNVTHCGTCNTDCNTPLHANALHNRIDASCAAGACLYTCKPGYASCGPVATDGVLTLLCTTSTLTNVSHCGSCGSTCPSRANAVAACAASACAYTCVEGYADCDGESHNGCEVALFQDNTRCGSCTVSCLQEPYRSSPNETYVCEASSCVLASCNSARIKDCVGGSLDGCETDTYTNRSHCGSCGNACPRDTTTTWYSCKSGSCVANCRAGNGNCNGELADGCEVNLSTNSSHCSSCNSACHTASPETSSAFCDNGVCRTTCTSPWYATCGGDAQPPCLTNLNISSSHCGSCDTRCLTSPDSGRTTTVPTCVDGLCTALTCLPGLSTCLPGENALSVSTFGCSVNLSSNVNNCGACSRACSAVFVDAGTSIANVTCQNGECVFGNCSHDDRGRNILADCDGLALNGCEIDLQTSAGNCGSCASNCSNLAPGRTRQPPQCVSGACACLPGVYAECDGDTASVCETNVRSNSSNCGSCGHVCGPQSSCIAGMCVCVAGMRDCDNDLQNGCEQAINDTGHCGTCSQSCIQLLNNPNVQCVTIPSIAPPPAPGAGGNSNLTQYVCTCPVGLTECGGVACVDITSSVDHCGACGQNCAGQNRLCVAGRCICAAGYGNCTASHPRECATDITTSKSNCGGCHQACGSNSICSSGVCSTCGTQPPYRFRDCNMDPADGCEQNVYDTGNLYCGACGVTCGFNEVCVGGQCTCLSNYGNCTTNPALKCASDFTSIRTCGNCSNTCWAVANAVASCVYNSGTGNRECSYDCQFGYRDCNANMMQDGCEVNVRGSDLDHCGACNQTCYYSPTTSNGLASIVCQTGQCVVDCLDGYDTCDGSAGMCAVHLRNSSTDCGSCDNDCSSLQVHVGVASVYCEESECQAVCAVGYQSCGSGRCDVDVHSDVRHCGACDQACPVSAVGVWNASCASATCSHTCLNDLVTCNVTEPWCVVDLQTDVHNCGTCGFSCIDALPQESRPYTLTECNDGGCRYVCIDDMQTCIGGGGTCLTNVTDSVDHCGTCGAACITANQPDTPHLANTSCVDRSCSYTCEDGWGTCGAPVNGDNICATHLQEDVDNCGQCGRSCNSPDSLLLADGTCANGECSYTCRNTLADCSLASPMYVVSNATMCSVNISSDTQHCGGCLHQCAHPNATNNLNTTACLSGTCTYACQDNFETCDEARLCGTSLLTDHQHCGACSTSCLLPSDINTISSTGCTAGSCSYTCDDSYTTCDGSQVCGISLLNDTANCGVCSASCLQPNSTNHINITTCVVGSCNYICEPYYSTCDQQQGQCEVSLLTDVSNCGSCSTECLLPNNTNNINASSCFLGECWYHCNEGYTTCPGGLICGVDLLTDVNNCGECSNACSSVYYSSGSSQAISSLECNMGACEYSCSSGYGTCSDPPVSPVCNVTLQTDVDNCGSCSRSCMQPTPTNHVLNTTCIDGECSYSCAANMSTCTSTICGTNTTMDVEHCGACDNACQVSISANAFSVCIDSSCGYRCTEGMATCPGDTVPCLTNTTSDDTHCGGCDALPCDSGSSCQNGVCVADPIICMGLDEILCGDVCVSLFNFHMTSCEECATNYADCDADLLSNGCEADLSTAETCGGCTGCPLPGQCQFTGQVYVCQTLTIL